VADVGGVQAEPIEAISTRPGVGAGGVHASTRAGSRNDKVIASPTGVYERLIHMLGVCRR